MKQLVIGWGNPWAGDDGIGPRAAERVAERVADRVRVLTSSRSGFSLAEEMLGYDRVIVADIHVDEADSPLRREVIRPRALTPPRHFVRHDGALSDALRVFRALRDPRLPHEVVLLSVPIPSSPAWRDGLSPMGERAAARLADAVLRALEVRGVA